MQPNFAFITRDGSGWVGQWSPGIGDPTLVGWVTVVLYLACAWLCWRCSKYLAASRHTPVVGREFWLWRAFCVCFCLLGVNKQLDLQSALTELGRIAATRQGWYAQRGLVQVAFIGVVAVGALMTMGGVLWLARQAHRGTRIAIFGLALVLGFVVIRAASFHHVDVLIGMSFLAIRFNWVMEISGISVVMFGAWTRRRRRFVGSDGPL